MVVLRKNNMTRGILAKKRQSLKYRTVKMEKICQ